MLKLLKIFIYLIVFIYSLLIFLPKENIYYFIANNLQKEKIFLNTTTIEDKFIDFTLNDLDIQYDDIKVAQISTFDIKTYLFYNQIVVKNIILDSSMQSFAPRTISKIDIVYNIVNPLFIDISIKSRFAQAKGSVDIVNKKINLTLNISRKFKRDYPMIIKTLTLKKNTAKGGIYTYEYSF